MTKRELDECPQCGAMFQRGRLACPECGSDARTGWQDAEEIDYQSVEILDEQAPTRPNRPWWAAVLLVLCVVALLLALVLR